jgi:hypothetical protein
MDVAVHYLIIMTLWAGRQTKRIARFILHRLRHA